MLKRISIIFVIFTFVLSILVLSKQDKTDTVLEIQSPTKILLSNQTFAFKNLQSFDSESSEYNKILAKTLNISETEALIMGNLAQYWSINLLSGRNVLVLKDDLVYDKKSYKTTSEKILMLKTKIFQK